MVTSVAPGRRVRAGVVLFASDFASLALVVAAALILLSIPAVWFARWLPWPLIVAIGHLGNRVGPFILAGPLISVLAWQAETPAIHNRHHGRIGGRRRWAVSIGALFSVVMTVIVLARP
jgi:hypothetical protein